MLPGILNQLGAESLTHLKKLANNVTSQFNTGANEAGQDEDDDVPGTRFSVTRRVYLDIRLTYLYK